MLSSCIVEDSAREALMAVLISKLAYWSADNQKNVFTICRFLPQCYSNLSSDIMLGFQEFCGPLLKSACKKVEFCREGIDYLIIEEIAPFE